MSDLLAQDSKWTDYISEEGTYVEKIGSATIDNFYYLSNKRDKRHLDIYLHSKGINKDSLIFTNNKGYLINSEREIAGVFTKDKKLNNSIETNFK